MRRRCIVRYVGAFTKANVGISNDNVCEKHTHRKTKVSPLNVNRRGVSRVLRQSRKV